MVFIQGDLIHDAAAAIERFGGKLPLFLHMDSDSPAACASGTTGDVGGREIERNCALSAHQHRDGEKRLTYRANSSGMSEDKMHFGCVENIARMQTLPQRP
jgi:hypothetical protein